MWVLDTPRGGLYANDGEATRLEMRYECVRSKMLLRYSFLGCEREENTKD